MFIRRGNRVLVHSVPKMYNRRALFILFVCLLISLTQSTLSKSGGKKEEKKEIKVEKKPDIVVKDDNLRDRILKTHDKFDTSKAKRDFVKLGYVTPWNGLGYDVAKWTAQKFTHISPVWFQMFPTKVDGQVSCDFKGQHDIDRGWLEDLRKNNSEIKIVPRFIFESSDAELFQQFISADTAQLRCAENLVHFLERNQFDGCVFEFWLQILVNTRGAAMEYLTEMTEIFGKRLRLRELQYIVPLTPPLQNMNPGAKTYLPEQVIPRLLEAVDYLNLMTYDFSGNDAEGNAPIPWIKNNLHMILVGHPQYSSKILIGLNYYGSCRGSFNDVILGKKYIELLEDPEYELLWNEISHENYLKSELTQCYFPTTKSINERLDLVESEKLAGIGIWEIGQGLNHFSSVL